MAPIPHFGVSATHRLRDGNDGILKTLESIANRTNDGEPDRIELWKNKTLTIGNCIVGNIWTSYSECAGSIELHIGNYALRAGTRLVLKEEPSCVADSSLSQDPVDLAQVFACRFWRKVSEH